MRPFSQKTTDQLLRWFLKQPEIVRWECHQEQIKRINLIKNEARQQGQKVESDGELYYCAFIYGIHKRCRLESNKKLRNTDDLEAVTAQRIVSAKAKSKAKQSPKLDRLHGDLEPVVLRLMRDGLTWQAISDYLFEHHGFNCVRQYLHKVFSGSKS